MPNIIKFGNEYVYRDGLTADRASTSALAIKNLTGTTTDGLYWIKNPKFNNGDPIQVYCDMNTDGGGWTLVMTVRGDAVGYMGWNNSTIQQRNVTTPSLQNAYSILLWSDYIKDTTGGTWQWMVEATDIYTTRNTYGGIFTANVATYSLNTNTASQTNITANVFWNTTGFIENSGIGQRVPFRDTSYTQAGVALYTTYPGSESWWGTITQSDTNYSSYKTGPWISGIFQAPNYKRVWIR